MNSILQIILQNLQILLVNCSIFFHNRDVFQESVAKAITEGVML